LWLIRTEFDPTLADVLGVEVAGALKDPMHCFKPAALPVLTALAKEFLVCDNSVR
jgi:hypothetical protein